MDTPNLDRLIILERARSSRAQARTTVGREFPISALSIAEQGPSPAIAHVSCALSTMPYSGFSPVRLQAKVSLDQPSPVHSRREVKPQVCIPPYL
jgi:hypothetical protein